MDTEVLVEPRIEDGQNLLAELAAAGLDVSVAFWVKAAEDGVWSLYVGSTSVEPGKVGDAYQALYACLAQLPPGAVEFSDVKFLPASDPAAMAARALRDRQPGRSAVRVQGRPLGPLAVEEAYIYPRIGGPMTRAEVLQALVRLANRPGGTAARPVVIGLRGGGTVRAMVTGFDLRLPGGLTIHTVDPASNSVGQIAGDEVVSIQNGW